MEAVMNTVSGLLAACLALSASLATAAPADRERSGKEIFEAQCSTCHAQGLHGAPRIDDRAAWTPRLRNGLDATVRSAIRGHGAMPARGGMADLTDTELRSAVLYLFNSAGPPPRPAQTPALGPNHRIVGGMEVFLGLKRVREGIVHVSVTLRDAATKAVIGDAQVEATVTNPVMGADDRPLQRVSIGKAVSYDSDFRVSGREPHVVTVRIRRPGSARPVETKFEYKG
jgi:cytochrome c5